MNSPSEARPRDENALEAPLASSRADSPAKSGVGREAFESPLPEGMRDLLPPKAVRQARIGSRLMRSFELCGYGRVWLPLFEYEEVLRRAETHRVRAGSNGTLRFVEPESGEVVALRSDMTPQIARVVSTRYRSAPRPVRLCYQGSVLRRRRERARTESQVVQAGAELVGMPGAPGDFEVLEVMTRAVQRTGLAHFVLDLGHAGIASALLGSVSEAGRVAVLDALNAKDRAALQHSAQALGLTRDTQLALAALTELQGSGEDAEFWRRADRALGTSPAAPAVRLLRELVDHVLSTTLVPEVVVDLGEVRGSDYYTGVMFQILAHGPGEPIALGGRYDTLYDRFGLDGTPAAGFAIDVHNLGWALEYSEVPDPGYPRLAADGSVRADLLRELRERAVVCAACMAPGELAAYAAAYQYDFTLRSDASELVLSHRTGEELRVPQTGRSLLELVELVHSFVVRAAAPVKLEPTKF